MEGEFPVVPTSTNSCLVVCSTADKLLQKPFAEDLFEYKLAKEMRGYAEEDLRCAQAIDASVTTYSCEIKASLRLIVCNGDSGVEAGVANLVEGVDSLSMLSSRTVEKAKKILMKAKWSQRYSKEPARREREKARVAAEYEISSDEAFSSVTEFYEFIGSSSDEGQFTNLHVRRLYCLY